MLALLFPVMPALRTYLRGQLAVHEQGIAIVAPGTTEIDFRGLGRTGDGAIIKDVPVHYTLGGGGGSDVAVDLAMYAATLEPRRGGAEDEVGGALDVAIVEIEAGGGHAGIDGVLIAQEATVDEQQAVALGVQGYGLA